MNSNIQLRIEQALVVIGAFGIGILAILLR